MMLIPIIFGVSFIVFFMMDGAEGNALDIIGADYSEEMLAELYHQYGYDRSVFYRYFMYMKNLLRGDLGMSIIYRRPVLELYLMRLPATLKLAGASILVAVLMSIPLGIKASTHHGSLIDNASMVTSLLGLSLPSHWLGLMLAVIFAQKLHWLPSGGDQQGMKSIILPAITIGTGLMATMTRTTRSSMLDVIRQDYLRTARAKGVPEKTVINKHATPCGDRNIIHSTAQPLAKADGIQVLYGNLAPKGALVKTSAVPEAERVFTGIARVFDSEDACYAAFREKRIQMGDAVVVRYEGPRGGPGMKELHRITEIIKSIPHTAVITDGRFSGASGGLSVGYLCPEAAEGGPIALVEDGDRICVDLYQGTLTLVVSEEELSYRRAQWGLPFRQEEKGLLDRYSRIVNSARQGARFCKREGILPQTS